MKNTVRNLFLSAAISFGSIAAYTNFGPSPIRADSRAIAPGTYPKEFGSYRDIVKRALPAVVSIEAQVRRDGSLRSFGIGSGVFVDSRGTILTNNHVVEGATQLNVYTNDGKKYTTGDIKTDKKTDLAVVRIRPDGPVPSLSFADSDEMEVGDRVLAIGAPYGLAGSVTNGIISAKSRNLKLNMYEDFLQTDAAVNPGNSGGPLVNMEGKIVGINSIIQTKSGGFQGISMAISSNFARKIMETLQKEGVVRRGYLGVATADLDDKLALKYGGSVNNRVAVKRIMEDTPAAKSDLKVGDIIVRIDDRAVASGDDVIKKVAELQAGHLAELTVVRDGQKVAVKVLIEAQPEKFGLRE